MGILDALLRRIGIALPPPGGAADNASPAGSGPPPAVSAVPPADAGRGGRRRSGRTSPPESAARRPPWLEEPPQACGACPSPPLAPSCSSCPQPPARRQPAPQAIAMRPSPQRRCDCGQPARYRLPVTIYHADLVTPYHTYLDLCEACYALELEGRAGL